MTPALADASSTSLSSNPHPENSIYSLLVPFTFFELSTSLVRSDIPNGSPLSLQTIGTALFTPWSSRIRAT